VTPHFLETQKGAEKEIEPISWNEEKGGEKNKRPDDRRKILQKN